MITTIEDSYIESLEAVINPSREKAVLTFDELMTRPREENPLLLEPYLPKTGIGVIAGTPDCGKSLFCRQFGLAVASGKTEFCGLRLNPAHGRAIYVSTEDSLDDAQAVIERQARGLQILQASPGLRYFDAAGATSEEILRTLIEATQSEPVDLIILDTWGDVFGGKDGNSNMEVRRALNPYYKLCSVRKCFILFVHHVNKSAYEHRPKQADLQGAAAFGQKVRVMMSLCKKEDGTRLLGVSKGNHIADDHKRRDLQLTLDPTTLLFSSKGFQEVRQEREEVDWDVIYGSNAKLTTAQLIDRLHEEYGIARSTAERWIKRDLIFLERGLYGRKAEVDYMDPYEPD